MVTVGEHQQSGNFILDSLPQAEYDLLRPHLKPIALQQGDVLVDLRAAITQVYFPVTCTVSWLNSTLEGDSVEVGVTGFEGLIGTVLLLEQDIAPWMAQVQLSGRALQLEAQIFVDALQRLPVLRRKVSAFTYQKMMQLTQSALCNRFHGVEQRLCRWLLAAQDRVDTAELLLTRDSLTKMSGSTRPTVSIVIGTLQSAGLIQVGYGRVTILNREEMEEATCECYHILKQQFNRYLQT